jgi:hypothetical protein
MERNSRLPSHVITVLAPQEANKARNVVGHARPAEENQILGVFLDRLSLWRAGFLAEFFVDEIPLNKQSVSI